MEGISALQRGANGRYESVATAFRVDWNRSDLMSGTGLNANKMKFNFVPEVRSMDSIWGMTRSSRHGEFVLLISAKPKAKLSSWFNFGGFKSLPL
jgi:hypothetical protein